MHRMFDNINGTVNDFLKKKFTPFDKIFKNTFNFQVFILDCSVTTKSDVEHFRFQKDLIKLLSIMSPIGKSLNPFYLAQFNQDYSW